MTGPNMPLPKEVEGQVPLQRFGEADEVARAALYRASDDSGDVTGMEIVVDGVLSQF
ncbi:MAG: SDR family oxidoreductase [Alphaproteobacteria bacterium]|nr:MAG: SDR family oxidoreductase [Alphaproteobacteria bacterium]